MHRLSLVADSFLAIDLIPFCMWLWHASGETHCSPEQGANVGVFLDYTGPLCWPQLLNLGLVRET